MNHIFSFEDSFELISVYKSFVLLMFSNKDDVDSLNECGFVKNDFKYLNKKGFKKPI